MTTETILTPEQVDSLLEGVLRASGSRLGNYTYQKTLDDLHSSIRSIEQAVLQSEQAQAWKRDAERLDFITSKPGVCYALVSDDSGRWALTDTGMSPVAPDQGFTETVGITSIVDPDMWKSSPREALDAAMEKQK